MGRTLRRSKTLAAASAILALPLAGAITASGADDPAFAGPLVISTLPGGTWAAATGDFDRDGRLDLATADGSDTLQVLEPGPSGRSGWRRAGVRAGTTNFFLRAADLDGDGDEDLVVADVAGAVVTLRCRGDGTFDAPEAVPEARRVRWVTAGDWEGDGTVDLAVAQFDLQSVAVLRGDGRGRFALTETHRMAGLPHAIEGLDYDGDGKPDLAAKLSDVGIQPFRGRGDGRFEPGRITADLGTDGNIITGDFDADGRGDLAIQCCGAALSAGDGSFRRSVAFAEFGTLAAGDLDGDRVEDLIHLGASSTALLVYLGRSDGQLDSAVSFGPTGLESLFLAADLDGDGAPDLVAAGVSGTSLTVLWGASGGGRMLETARRIGGLDAVGQIAAADIDRDGRPDLLFPVVGRPEVYLFLGPGLAEPAGPSRTITVRGAFTSLAVADLDADGVPDLAGADRITGEARIAILDRSAAVRSEAALPAGLFPSGAVVGRLDEGESPDLAVACAGSNQVAIFLNDGRGTFAEAGKPATIAKPRGLAAGDLDGDSRVDLVVYADGGLVRHYGLGGGTFAGPVALPADQGGRYVDVAVADVGGDGVTDLVALDAFAESVVLFRGRGGRAFDGPRSTAVGANPVAIELADLNGDGLLDLTTTNGSAWSASVLLNRGAEGFGGRIEAWLGFRPSGHLLADLDLDGALDLVAFKASAAATLPGLRAAPKAAPFRRGDADGDGRVEINDPVALLSRLFTGGAALPCDDASDANDDGSVDLSDAVFTLDWLFLAGETPPPPGPARCGDDPTGDGLGCASNSACR